MFNQFNKILEFEGSKNYQILASETSISDILNKRKIDLND